MKKKNKKPLVRIVVLALGGFLILILAVYIYIAYLLPIPDSLLLNNSSVSTKILDRNGKLLYQVVSNEHGRKSYVPLTQMPQAFVQAIIASEDSNFYQHIGVDFGAIARAFFYNSLAQKITSGASTITQQLVRNMLGTNRTRTLSEKLVESIYAVRLSNAYSKDEILEKYLNTVYFGNLAYGAGEAAQNYFGKNLGELDLAELSMLAGLPQSPSGFNPLVYPERAKERQKYVLDRLRQTGSITDQQYSESSAEKLKYRKQKASIEAPHFVHHLLAELESRYGEDAVYGDGLTVTTTIDLDMEKKAESIINYQLEKLAQKNVTDASLLASDVTTGQVLAWVGSADYYNDAIDGQVDIITSLRQPGSALKPFLYLLALESGATLSDIIPDLPLQIQTDNGVYAPLNYDLDFHGPVRLREALANSFNIPAVKTQQKLGTAPFLNFLRRQGLDSLNQSPEYYGYSLTLGGGEVRLLDLANAYLTLANLGTRKPFSTILEIKDSNGKTLEKWQKPQASTTLSQNGQQNAWLITDAISDPNARLKSFGEGNLLELSFPAAVKTGTTRNFKDNWTMGFSSNVLTGVWVGNADATSMENISGIDGAGPIWHDFMEYAHDHAGHFPQTGLTDSPTGWSSPIAPPVGIIQKQICAISGLLPTDNCLEKINEFFLAGREPKKPDNYWQSFDCNGQTKSLISYPDEFKKWAEDRGFNPPQNCRQLSTSSTTQGQPTDGSNPITEPFTILSPLPGDIYEIDPNIPLASQKIIVKIRLNSQKTATRLTLSIDAATILDLNPQSPPASPEITSSWLPARGPHTLTATITADPSQKSFTQTLHFEVR